MHPRYDALSITSAPRAISAASIRSHSTWSSGQIWMSPSRRSGARELPPARRDRPGDVPGPEADRETEAATEEVPGIPTSQRDPIGDQLGARLPGCLRRLVVDENNPAGPYNADHLRDQGCVIGDMVEHGVAAREVEGTVPELREINPVQGDREQAFGVGGEVGGDLGQAVLAHIGRRDSVAQVQQVGRQVPPASPHVEGMQPTFGGPSKLVTSTSACRSRICSVGL